MKKALPLIAILAATAALSACQDSGDSHGVKVDRGGFFSNLFGAAPAQTAPVAQPATQATADSAATPAKS